MCQPNNKNIRVDNVADFINRDRNDVVIFLKDGREFKRRIERVNTNNNQISLDSAPGILLPEFAGIRIPERDETYEVDTRYLEQAFGRLPGGGDGGAFIEFKTLPADKGSGNVPKYAVFPSSSIAFDYSWYWFNNKNERTRNVRYVLAANAESGNGTFGWAWSSEHVAIVFDGPIKQSNDQRDDTAVHEIGHLFGLVGPPRGPWAHVDVNTDRRSHCNLDRCVMSYGRNRTNGIVEFSIDCLLVGSSGGAGDSLRDQSDR